MTKRILQIIFRFDNLRKKELNKKNNKEAYIRNDVTATVIKCSRGEKKRHKKNR